MQTVDVARKAVPVRDRREIAVRVERALDKLKLCTVTFNWPCHGDDVRKLLRLEDCVRYLRLTAYSDWQLTPLTSSISPLTSKSNPPLHPVCRSS